MTRLETTFLALVVTQAAHSVEEYAGHLWIVFPPARFLSGVLSADLERNFVLLNLVLVAFGFWCFFWPLRRRWPSATRVAWLWAGIELFNGLGHLLWSLRQGSYTPGAATAPVLLVLALYLARQLRTRVQPASAAGHGFD